MPSSRGRCLPKTNWPSPPIQTPGRCLTGCTRARTDFEVIAGSGTGDLARVTGSGAAAAANGSPGTYRLDLDLPAG